MSDETKQNEAEHEVVKKPRKKRTKKDSGKYYILTVNYGCDSDGSVRYPKGTKIKLSKEKAEMFKNLKYI